MQGIIFPCLLMLPCSVKSNLQIRWINASRKSSSESKSNSGFRPTASSESPEPSTEPCRIAMMIATKNSAVTTATVAMTTVRKARAPGNFVNANQITPYAADQTFCLKLSHGFNILLNILQSPYIAVMFLQAVFSMFALQMVF